jgi:cytoskeleton protein RodZ
LPSFGEKLKLEREKRKITLDQISSTTKIGTRMLQALEDEKFNQLPGGIFNKGFVRAYARAVGIDEDQAVSDYLEASGDAPSVRPDAAARESQADPRHTPEENGHLEIRAEVASRQLPWGLFAVILLLIALALTFWSHRRREREKLSAQAPNASETSEVQSSDQNSSSSRAELRHSTPVSENTPPRPLASSANTTPQRVAPPASQSLPSTTSSIPGPGEFVVAVLAREQSWLSVSVDGKSAGSELLEAGEERNFHGRRAVVARIGNAGGLDFLLNGKKLPVGGDFGEVKTVTIGPSGVVPTPAPAAPPPSAPE